MLKFVNIKKKLIIQHTVTVHVRTYSIYNKKQTMKEEKLPAIRYITIQHSYGTEHVTCRLLATTKTAPSGRLTSSDLRGPNSMSLA